jgi:hypothetical protein
MVIIEEYYLLGCDTVSLRASYVSCFIYSSVSNMEAIDSSDTSVNFYRLTRSRITEYITVNTYCSDDFVPNIQSDSKLLSGFP